MTLVPTPSAARSLAEHTLAHAGLLDKFEDHQCALISRDLERASTLLEEFTRELRMHRAGEEEFVLPAYGELGLSLEGGEVELFLSEHEQLGWWLKEMRADLDALERVADEREVGSRDLLTLLDRQATFKHLLIHHDEREGEVLYPALDRNLTREQVEDILKLIDRHEEVTRASWT